LFTNFKKLFREYRQHERDARDTGMSPLRILFALPGLHRVNRGAEVALEEVARRAARDHGFDVTVVGSGAARPDEPYDYRQVACVHRESFEHFPRIPYARDPYAWEELTFAPGLLRAYSPREFDLTVTCGYPYTNWILRSRRQDTNRPAHVFVTQNGDWMVQARNAEFKHFNCDALVCTNQQYYERHKDRYPSALIPNGVDTAAFHPPAHRPAGPPTVLVVSALMPGKRVPEAIRAVAQLADVQLIVAGGGEQRQEVDALGRQLLGPRYRRLVRPRDQMPDLYRCADVLLHMSKDEAFGNIYVEALASGLPIVAHDSPVTRWIVEDQATLIDTDDFGAVARALRDVIGQQSPAQMHARRAVALRRFSWEIVASQYCEFFEDVHRRSN
jgi:glycosyltransferase involved in cell wall biosynthesis